MTKRARLTPADTPEKKENMEDWFSKFPDDILVNIISRLTLKEAARTSVLSSRWKYLWNFTTALDFAGIGKDIIFPSKEEKTTAKKVQNFELDFWPPSHINDYAFPLERYNFLKRGHGLSGIKSLRSLCLSALKVSGEVLEFFIHSCPHLEHLYVANSSELLSLKVVGSSIPLKFLDIHYCYSMKEIDISASSLVSFRYSGKDIKLHVGNVPQLVDVVIHGAPLFQIRYFIGSVVCCFPQLKTLDLECCNEVFMEFGHWELPKLLHLKLTITEPNCESLLGLSFVLKACPFLQKLVIKIWNNNRTIGEKRHQIPVHFHQHLKVVELHEFRWLQIDPEIAFFIFRNAKVLEKMIIKPSSSRRKRALKHCANMLKDKLPQGVDLVVGSL
ncbi:F-box domain-containing protein [Citrus sinensis]|nr:F-box domain-containing protein [Citrus sinensis]